MQRHVVTVPRGLFREKEMTWDIDWRGQDGGVDIGGNPSTVYNAFPRWIGNPELHLHNTAIAQWRAIRAAAQGRLGIYRVPMSHALGFDFHGNAGAYASTGIPHSTGDVFSNGQGYLWAPKALASGAVSAGATEFRIDIAPCSIAPGVSQLMSYDDWPWEVISATAVSGTLYDIVIQMPLRTAIPDGGEIDMTAWGRFELASERSGNPVYRRTLRAAPRVELREVLVR